MPRLSRPTVGAPPSPYTPNPSTLNPYTLTPTHPHTLHPHTHTPSHPHTLTPSQSAEWVKRLQQREAREAETTLGFKQGLGRLKQVAQKVAVEDGDAPPPLQ